MTFLGIGTILRSMLRPEDQAIYDRVQERFAEHERSLGRVLFRSHDWMRMRWAFAMSSGLRCVGDVGMGQGQLINLLAARPDVEKVYGIDMKERATLLRPSEPDKYEIVCWDITEDLADKLAPVDLMIAMEILEHIDPELLPDALQRVRALSRNGNLLIMVPYQEKEPLYQFDKPHGHKQSFDDDALLRVFGNQIVWSQMFDYWYCIFSSDLIDSPGEQEPEELVATVQQLLTQG